VSTVRGVSVFFYGVNITIDNSNYQLLVDNLAFSAPYYWPNQNDPLDAQVVW
jgi:hypothetical protein